VRSSVRPSVCLSHLRVEHIEITYHVISNHIPYHTVRSRDVTSFLRPNFPFWINDLPITSALEKESPLWTNNPPHLRKRCKIRGKLLLFAQRKSHTVFPLVPKVVTFHDLEPRNNHYFALFRRIRQRPIISDWLKLDPCIQSAIKMPKESIFRQYTIYGNILRDYWERLR